MEEIVFPCRANMELKLGFHYYEAYGGDNQLGKRH